MRTPADSMTDALWTRYRGEGNPDARARLLDGYLGLVRHCARELVRRGIGAMEYEELVSAGTVGLIQALEGFDPERRLAFSTYAMPRIRGAMLDELRTRDWLPRGVRARSRKIAHATSQLQHQLRLAMAENGDDSRRKVTELADQLTSARNALDGTERDMAKVRLAHGQHVQAAEQARQPVKALDVKCPGCGALVSPQRTGAVVNGYRAGTFDCAACDVTFEARWSGGTDPVVTVREI